jgi:hypothetical protein
MSLFVGQTPAPPPLVRAFALRALDDESTVVEVKHATPPEVPERLKLFVPDVVTGDPVIANIPEDDPELTLRPTLLTVP